MTEVWTCRHFSLANPLDDGASDLPRLLRRVADQIDAREITFLQLRNVTISLEITAEGPWWSVTVYWSSNSGDAEPGQVPRRADLHVVEGHADQPPHDARPPF